MKNLIKSVLKDEAGATAVEYGLIVSLIVIAAMASIITVGSKTGEMWNKVSAKVTSV